MRRIRVFLAVIVLLLMLSVAQVMAQGEITLEGLAEQLAALVERVDAIEKRFEFTPPVDEDGNCRLAIRNRVHPETMAAYLDTYPDDRTPQYVYITSVHDGADSTLIKFNTYVMNKKDKHVTETWDGCEFVGHSDWWEEE